MRYRTLLFPLCLAFLACQAGKPPLITGELKKWHTITLTFTGPQADENDPVNPFLDYRFEVIFRQGQHAFTIPGYFAADGAAATSGAASGNKWRVHFCPDEEGEWSYYATLRKGPEAALSYEPESLPSARYFDAMQGKFVVQPTDKSGSDFRGRGRLEYYSQPWWRLAESGDYYIKTGIVDDHFLARAQANPSAASAAIDDLAAAGVNALTLLVMNSGAEGPAIRPWNDSSDQLRYDVSQLDQWENILAHANQQGVLIQLKTQSRADALLLDGGNLEKSRQLYYRMLIARFSHLPALVWQLGESAPAGERAAAEQSTDQLLDMAQYFYENDPYLHPILYQGPGGRAELLTSGAKFNAMVLSGPAATARDRLQSYAQQAGKRGLIHVITPLALDAWEKAPAAATLPADRCTVLRQQLLWASLMAGGAGCDVALIDAEGSAPLQTAFFRYGEPFWQQCQHARTLFRELRAAAMQPHHELVSGGGLCLSDGSQYLLYLPRGGSVTLDPGASSKELEMRWYDPRLGEFSGASRSIRGGGRVTIGPPPAETSSDWAVILR